MPETKCARDFPDQSRGLCVPNRIATTRRTLIAGLAGTMTSIPFAASADDAPRPLNIVVSGGHPGDPEYGGGGTIAKYVKQGHHVTLLYLNRGDDPAVSKPGCSAAYTNGPRVQEAMEACRILGARPVFLPQCNGKAVVDPAHYQSVTDLIGSLQPHILFTHWPVDNHPDHRAMATFVIEAWQRLGRRMSLYFYEVSDGEDTVMFTPTDYVDITEAEPIKRRACYAHASQTPDRFYALQTNVSLFRGIQDGCHRAEAFARHPQSPRGVLP
jgi:N-acetylglucosamine malate deacetylase 1